MAIVDNRTLLSGFESGDTVTQPDDLSGAAVFFASSDSDQVHGAHLLVDGGWAAW